MGLVDLTQEEFEKTKELLRLLGTFGITEDDLRYLPEAIKKIKETQVQYKPREMTKDEKHDLEERKKKVLTPEEFFDQFKTEVEDFYPNGKH